MPLDPSVREAVEALVLVAWVGDDARLLRLNAAWARLGVALDVAGRRLGELLDPADGAAAEASLKALGAGGALRFDARLRPSEGSAPVWLRFQGERDEADGAIRLVAVDVTDLKPGAPAGAIEAELRAKLAASERRVDQLSIVPRMLNTAPVIFWTTDSEGTIEFSEGKALELMGFGPGEMVGLNVFEMYRGSPAEPVLRSAFAGETRSSAGEGAPGVFFETWFLPMKDEATGKTGLVGLSIDATERQRSEQELLDKVGLIEQQRATIHALATPIIRVWDEVLCLPVIGTLDGERTSTMMERLLESIVREQARFAIVDLTGVELVDTSTADHLLRLLKAAKVLGVEGVLCGIQPSVAQTVVALGLDLSSVRMMRTLQDALRWCVGARNQAHLGARRRGARGGPAPSTLE